MSFFTELRRRNVYRVGAAYLVVAWLIAQVVSLAIEPLGLPEWFDTAVLVLLLVGFPIALLFAWAYELTPQGLTRTDRERPKEPEGTSPTRRRSDLLAGIAIGGAVVAIVFQLLLTNSDSVTEEELLALEAFIEAGAWDSAYTLARRLEVEYPDSAELADMWPRFAQRSTISSDPPGALVSRSDYSSDDTDWEELGSTPLETWLPYGLSKIRYELEAYSPVLHTTRLGGVEMLGATIEDQRVFAMPTVVLDSSETLPEGMVRVPGWEEFIDGSTIQFGDYFLDRYEVTNSEFKEFVDDRGYERQEFWQEPVFVDGQELSWQESRGLFVDSTGFAGPSTWDSGDYPEGRGDYPVNGVSWYEAMAYARWAGRQLPTVYHFNHAINRNSDAWRLPNSNLSGTALAATGTFQGLSQYGNYDLAGNVREWAINTVDDQRFIFGAAWPDEPYRASFPGSLSPHMRTELDGFRLMQTFDDADVVEAANGALVIPPIRDLSEYVPVSDETFEAYRRMFAYDAAQLLNARIEEIQAFRNWTRQRITFDAAYGEPRMVLYLFLPNDNPGPFQTIIYFPNVWEGVYTIDQDPFHVDFIVKDGRAVAYPMFMGGFERSDALSWGADQWNSVTGRNRLIQIHQDLRRSLDYLDTRTDVDHDAYGLYSLSVGGFLAPAHLALEPRIGAAVLTVAGLFPVPMLEEIDPVTYLSRVQQPVLMLNGQLDWIIPYETSALPFFNLLGSREQSELQVEPGGHFVPRNILVMESLAWFDEHLGSPRGP